MPTQDRGCIYQGICFAKPKYYRLYDSSCPSLMFRMAVSLFFCVQYERPCQFHICFQSFFKSIKTLPICFNEITLGCFFSSSCFLTSWFLDPIRGHLAALTPCPFGLRSDTARKTRRRRRRRTAIDPACNYTQWVRSHTHTNMPNCRRRGARQAPIRLEEKEEEGKGKKAQAETG